MFSFNIDIENISLSILIIFILIVLKNHNSFLQLVLSIVLLGVVYFLVKKNSKFTTSSNETKNKITNIKNFLEDANVIKYLILHNHTIMIIYDIISLKNVNSTMKKHICNKISKFMKYYYLSLNSSSSYKYDKYKTKLDILYNEILETMNEFIYTTEYDFFKNTIVNLTDTIDNYLYFKLKSINAIYHEKVG